MKMNLRAIKQPWQREKSRTAFKNTHAQLTLACM